MLSFILRRLLFMIPTMFAVTVLTFTILIAYEALNGSFVERLQLDPTLTDQDKLRIVRDLGLDDPYHVRYFEWVWGIFVSTNATEPETSEPWQVWSSGGWNVPLIGVTIPYPIWRPYFGLSFQLRRPVTDIVVDAIPLTLLMSIPVFIFVWIVSVPIGIYSATHQYSMGDHMVTFFGFLGLSIPNFLLGLLILFFLSSILNVGQYCIELSGRPLCADVAGLFSSSNIGGSPWPWHWDLNKFVDYLWHMMPVVIVLGTSAMATLIRITRGSMLDILGSNYVKTARSKGLSERKVIYKHAVRNAINPLISVFGQFLPFLIQGSLIVAIVLNIQTVDAVFFDALGQGDVYLMMTILAFYALILLLGNLISDILLAFVDPRIRYE